MEETKRRGETAVHQGHTTVTKKNLATAERRPF